MFLKIDSLHISTQTQNIVSQIPSVELIKDFDLFLIPQ